MGEKTKIEWATHSMSPWIGCARKHTGCDNCYAEAMAGRLGVTWGPNGTRLRTAESTWKQVEKWNRADQPFLSWTNHERPRVFPSLCDPFEDYPNAVEVVGRNPAGDRSMDHVRRDFFALIDRCQNLDFLLLTKRPENVRRMWPVERDYNPEPPRDPYEFRRRRKNCWLLYSASDQQTLEAGLRHLLACRDLVPVLGLSLEPLVGPVEFGDMIYLIDWCIVGGESGPRARPCDVSWIRSVVEQCKEAGVACFVKQLGSRPVWNPADKCDQWPEYVRFDYQNAGESSRHRIVLRDPKGGDPDEWPEDLRVREFPHV